jgi:hypothetical protein
LRTEERRRNERGGDDAKLNQDIDRGKLILRPVEKRRQILIGLGRANQFRDR